MNFNLCETKRYLYGGILDKDTVALPLSAASIQASRLCSTTSTSSTSSEHTFAFASGTCVYEVKCNPSRKRTSDAVGVDEEHDEENEKENNKNIVKEALVEDYLIPSQFQKLSVTKNMVHSTHETEIQSIIYDKHNKTLGSIDSYGKCILTTPTNKWYINIPNKFDGMKGWTGITKHKENKKGIIITRSMYKDIIIYDENIILNKFHTHLTPTCLKTYENNHNILISTEETDIVIYDIRDSNQKQNRKTLSNSRLYSVDNLDDIIIASGADRTVHVVDIRKLDGSISVNDRWTSCLKYECAGVCLSKKSKDCCYVCGIDNEISCGTWDSNFTFQYSSSKMMSGAETKSKNRLFGFRGDVRILGMDRSNNDSGEECIGAVTETGAFYMLRC